MKRDSEIGESLRYHWPSIWRLIVFFAGAFILFYFLANRGHFAMMFATKTLSGKTSGWIVDRKVFKGISQTLAGNTERINGLVVKFSYSVNGKVFQKEELLNYSFIDAVKLNYIFKTKLPIKTTIRYDLSFPQNSALVLE